MNTHHQQLTILGIGLGLCFPLIAIPLDIHFNELDFGWSAIGQVHSENPLHWIVDSAPLVLGTIFYFLGKNVAERRCQLVKLNEHMNHRCQNVSEFVEALDQDDFTLEFQDSDDDIIATLNRFRNNLKRKNDSEKERTWINEGVAKFSDLLRADADDIPSFCQNILSNLLQYVSMNQGSIFVLNETDDGPCL